MDQALLQVGLPVSCTEPECGAKAFVKPGTDHDGWYKSRLLRFKRKRWFCPEHSDIGRAVDKRFYESSLTPEPRIEPAEQTEASIEDLYKLLD